MPNIDILENKMPVAPLKLCVLSSSEKIGNEINDYLVSFRHSINQPHHDSPAFDEYVMDDYRLDFSLPRFGSGEAKCVINETVRGKDIFILLDVTNSSITYKINDFENHMSPDDHFQDLKRVIAAIQGKAHRITVIMPFLYEGRQHKRAGRESLDCAIMLKELKNMGITNFITFDAHDPTVQNATPIHGFDNFLPFYQFLVTLLENEKGLSLDKANTIVISPDEGALDRAIYFATVMGVDTGMFYKRRDYSKIVNGKNPIVAHEFLGDNIAGKDAIIVDDMISSGESMLDTAKQLKAMNAKRVFICCTFGLFTNGFDAFDKAYRENVFDRVITTNLTYQHPDLINKPYYSEADMSKFLASIIDFMNHDATLQSVITPTEKIKKILDRYKNNK